MGGDDQAFTIEDYTAGNELDGFDDDEDDWSSGDDEERRLVVCLRIRLGGLGRCL